MPNATTDIDTRYREDFDYELDCAAAQKFFKGTFVGLNAAGLAGNSSATFNKVAGIMYLEMDNPAGFNGPARLTVGGEKIQVRRGCHRMRQDGTLTNAHVGKVAAAIDDQSVGLAGLAPAGVVERVDADGYVWVNLDIARSVAAGNGVV